MSGRREETWTLTTTDGTRDCHVIVDDEQVLMSYEFASELLTRAGLTKTHTRHPFTSADRYDTRDPAER